jgi:hypothetical protein
LAIVDVQFDAEKQNVHDSRQPRTCKEMSSLLNPRSLAEYTGHLILSPKGSFSSLEVMEQEYVSRDLM